MPPPPRSTLFPYTTLFRSQLSVAAARIALADAGLGPGAGLGLVLGAEFGDVRSTREFVDGYLGRGPDTRRRSEEHTSELQSRRDLVCRLLLEKKKKITARK